MIYAISGPPSVGKSTQGSALAEFLGVKHLSSGEVIRAGARSGDREATRLAAIVADGTLAPSDAIVQMMFDRFDQPDCAMGFVIDGFPRRVFEARAFVDRYGPRIEAFVVLEAGVDALMARVRQRARQSSLVRSDDDPELFPGRVATYLRETQPVRAYIQSRGVPVFKVDADPEVEEVQSSMRRVLDLDLASEHEEDAMEAPCFI